MPSVISLLSERIISETSQKSFYYTSTNSDWARVSRCARFFNWMISWIIPCIKSTAYKCQKASENVLQDRLKSFLNTSLSMEGLTSFEKVITLSDKAKSQMDRTLVRMFDDALAIVKLEKQRLTVAAALLNESQDAKTTAERKLAAEQRNANQLRDGKQAAEGRVAELEGRLSAAQQKTDELKPKAAKAEDAENELGLLKVELASLKKKVSASDSKNVLVTDLRRQIEDLKRKLAAFDNQPSAQQQPRPAPVANGLPPLIPVRDTAKSAARAAHIRKNSTELSIDTNAAQPQLGHTPTGSPRTLAVPSSPRASARVNDQNGAAVSANGQSQPRTPRLGSSRSRSPSPAPRGTGAAVNAMLGDTFG